MQNACPALVPERPVEERFAPALAPVEPTPRREPERGRKETLRPWSVPLLAFAGVSLLVVLVLLPFARIVQLQSDLIAKKETLAQLLHEKAELQLGIQQLSALNRVEAEACRLGMVHPENWQVLDLVHLARQELDGKIASAQAPPVGR